MSHLRHLLLAVAAAMPLAGSGPACAQTIIDEWQTVKAPPPPALKAVDLDPATTAILVIDIIRQTCNARARPRCVAMIPRLQRFLDEARAKGVFIVYSLFPSPSPATFPDPKISDYVPEVAPKRDEPVVTAFVDKFNLAGKDTGLEKILKDRGIKTVIPVGVASHNGVLFTSVAAALRGFDVDVPVDGMAGNNAYDDQLAAYTLSSSIVFKVTLTSIEMMKFR